MGRLTWRSSTRNLAPNPYSSCHRSSLRWKISLSNAVSGITPIPPNLREARVYTNKMSADAHEPFQQPLLETERLRAANTKTQKIRVSRIEDVIRFRRNHF